MKKFLGLLLLFFCTMAFAEEALHSEEECKQLATAYVKARVGKAKRRPRNETYLSMRNLKLLSAKTKMDVINTIYTTNLYATDGSVKIRESVYNQCMGTK